MATTSFPRFGGDLFGHFILELARELSAQGVEVEVVAPHAQGLSRAERLEGIAVKRFCYVVPAGWQRLAYGGGIPSNLKQSWMARLQVPLFLLGFWWQILRRSHRCDIVHCHWTCSGLVAHWATRWRRKPLVLSVRGTDIHLLGKGILGWVNSRIYRRMDRIVAVSEDIACKLEEAGVKREKIRVVYNGVDRRFHPRDLAEMRRELSLPPGRFIVLFVGLLVPVKGVDMLLRALSFVDEERLLCILVGEGTLRAELEEQARELGLEGRVEFAGRRPTAEIPLWLNAADVLVLPSRSEGRPNVVLEAQACGTPVVATRVGGTPELVRHGETGLLVESGDIRALAACLKRLADDGEFRCRLGRAGRQRVAESGLSWKASARQMETVYREVLEAG